MVARTRKLRIAALSEFEWVAVAGVAGRRGTYYPRRRLGVSTDVVAVMILILIVPRSSSPSIAWKKCSVFSSVQARAITVLDEPCAGGGTRIRGELLIARGEGFFARVRRFWRVACERAKE